MSDRIEVCCNCGDPTGKAGPMDDSVYCQCGVGPFCDNCDDQHISECLAEHVEKNAALAARIAELEGAIRLALKDECGCLHGVLDKICDCLYRTERPDDEPADNAAPFEKAERNAK